MKLLEKSQVNSLRQEEQKAIIDSGVSLARKVDTLRKELLELEKRRFDFIAGSRKTLEDAIRDLKDAKVNLEIEVLDARKVLEKLREPLDGEWEKVMKAKHDLEESQERIDAFITDLGEERKAVEQDKRAAEIVREEATKQRDESTKLLEESSANHAKSVQALAEAQASKDRHDVMLYNTELRLSDWEKKLKAKESTLKKDQEALNREKKALEVKKSRWKKT